MKGQHRTFSTSFKKEKVTLIEEGKLSVRELSDIYEVSCTAIYKWIKKFSKLPRDERIVVEKISEEGKNRELQTKIRDLERSVGQKQLELDYYKTIVNLISEETGEDVKKKYKRE
jgi:transposase-like protein